MEIAFFDLMWYIKRDSEANAAVSRKPQLGRPKHVLVPRQQEIILIQLVALSLSLNINCQHLFSHCQLEDLLFWGMTVLGWGCTESSMVCWWGAEPKRPLATALCPWVDSLLPSWVDVSGLLAGRRKCGGIYRLEGRLSWLLGGPKEVISHRPLTITWQLTRCFSSYSIIDPFNCTWKFSECWLTRCGVITAHCHCYCHCVVICRACHRGYSIRIHRMYSYDQISNRVITFHQELTIWFNRRRRRPG